MRFVGRAAEFNRLDAEFKLLDATSGRLIAVRGRRQVGKSRMLTEWLRRRGHRHIYYQALNKPVAQELESLRLAVARSGVGPLSATAASGAIWPTWEAVFAGFEAAALHSTTTPTPLVVVIDELPYLIGNDPSFEATLQAAWDHQLQHAPVMLIVVGSDLSMMEALTSYGRPLYSRVDVEMRVDPLNVADVADLLSIGATEAFDTYLVTGGFPKIVASRAEHPTQQSFLDAAMADEAHPLVYTGQRMLDAEFPTSLAARSVLESIGHGERTFNHIQSRAAVSERTLTTALDQLTRKIVIAAENPLSARLVKGRTRYRVCDPYLRFWLRFLSERTDDIARGLGDVVAAEIAQSWQKYAGEAVEPLVRDCVQRLLPDPRLGAARHVGSFWGRDNRPQVDLVGTEQRGINRRVEFAGSIKWRAGKPFGAKDTATLDGAVGDVPGWESTSVRLGVSRSGFAADAGLDVEFTPDNLIIAWA